MEKIESIKALLRIECRIDPSGCGGQWCKARNDIKEAFGLNKKPVVEIPSCPLCDPHDLGQLCGCQ